jgi:hypothetical protein
MWAKQPELQTHASLRCAKRTRHYYTCIPLRRNTFVKNGSRCITKVYKAELYKDARYTTHSCWLPALHCVPLLPMTAVPLVSGGGSYLSEQGDKAAGGIAYCTVRWNSDWVGRGDTPGPTYNRCTIFANKAKRNGAGSFLTIYSRHVKHAALCKHTCGPHKGYCNLVI